MGLAIAVWLLRFAVFAGIFLAVAGVWIHNAQGWKSLGLLGATIMFGIVAALAYAAAVAIAVPLERQIVRAALRPLLHALATFVLFVVLTMAINGWFFATPWEFLWQDLGPFAILVAVAALAQAAVGLLMQRWLNATPRQA